ncbi:hypothetical protein FF1_004567 [Malus domestica]
MFSDFLKSKKLLDLNMRQLMLQEDSSSMVVLCRCIRVYLYRKKVKVWVWVFQFQRAVSVQTPAHRVPGRRPQSALFYLQSSSHLR